MKKQQTVIARIDTNDKKQFVENCKGTGKPSFVLRELVNKFNSDERLRNSIRVKVELSKKN